MVHVLVYSRYCPFTYAVYWSSALGCRIHSSTHADLFIPISIWPGTAHTFFSPEAMELFKKQQQGNMLSMYQWLNKFLLP